MAVVQLNVTFDGVTDVARLPGENSVEWFGTPPNKTSIGQYSVFLSSQVDSLDAEASLTGSNWRVNYFRIAGDDHHTTIKDLDNGANRDITFLELGYNSDVQLISTRAQYIFGWDGDKHVVTLGNQQQGQTFSINLYAKENILTTGSAWVGAIETGGSLGDTITIGSGGAGSVSTGGGKDTITATTGFVGSIRSGGGNDKIDAGTGYVESISAGAGNDVVKIGTGGAGQAVLSSGNDKIHVSEMPADFGLDFRGQGGMDTVYFSGFSVGVTFSLNTTGYQNVASDKGWFRQSSTENVSGTGKADKLTGNDGKNTLFGRNGNDRLDGLAGNDKLVGGNGKDKLAGGAGNDILIGQGGADVFIFGANGGTDKVRGFQDGTDILRIAGHSGGLNGLSISTSNGDKIIDYDGGTIVLVNGAGVTLTNADFDFV